MIQAAYIPDGRLDGWSLETWERHEKETRRAALRCRSDRALWERIIVDARTVLRTFSTSFFLVTRFLPRAKREMVEAIYAVVRYPDEIVDTFPLNAAERLEHIHCWQRDYERAILASSLRESLEAGISPSLSAFAHVVRTKGIPTEHYRSFLQAMRMDAAPRSFTTLDDLIENYIYGSAIVVGYFLAYVYGPEAESEFERTLRASRDLGIALQLTNFLRDVRDDQRRGRIYLPLDMLAEEGLTHLNVFDEAQHPAINRVLHRLSASAEEYYARSFRDLDAFSGDCRTAIRACIDVYRKLNERFAATSNVILSRASVPMVEKFRVLPPSKYWRLPMAYLTR